MDETKWALVSAIIVRKFEVKNLSYDTRGQKKSTPPLRIIETEKNGTGKIHWKSSQES